MLSPNRRPQHGDRVLGCKAELSIRCCAGTEVQGVRWLCRQLPPCSGAGGAWESQVDSLLCSDACTGQAAYAWKRNIHRRVLLCCRHKHLLFPVLFRLSSLQCSILQGCQPLMEMHMGNA